MSAYIYYRCVWSTKMILRITEDVRVCRAYRMAPKMCVCVCECSICTTHIFFVMLRRRHICYFLRLDTHAGTTILLKRGYFFILVIFFIFIRTHRATQKARIFFVFPFSRVKWVTPHIYYLFSHAHIVQRAYSFFFISLFL